MGIKIVFKTPHVNLAGGTKVILKLANMLATKKEFDVTVAVDRAGGNFNWFKEIHGDINFTFKFNRDPHWDNTLFTADCLIDYADSNPYVPLSSTTKHVLLLQGFGTQQHDREVSNLLYRYDSIIATSRWLADMAVRCGHDQIYMCHPGIDDIFKPQKVPKVGTTIGCLYHPSQNKNVAAFMESMAALSGTNIKNLRALLLSVKLPDSKIVGDWSCLHSILVSPPLRLLPYIYSSCDFWVAPAINEGFGLSPLEAMACGVPVFWNPSFGLSEYMQHQHNCLFVGSSKESISNMIIKTIGNNALFNTIIENGKITASKFSWESSFNAFLESLGEIIR